MRISDWSSDVCSSDLSLRHLDRLRLSLEPDVGGKQRIFEKCQPDQHDERVEPAVRRPVFGYIDPGAEQLQRGRRTPALFLRFPADRRRAGRSEEHTSELQSLMRISYAVFCLKKKKHN